MITCLDVIVNSDSVLGKIGGDTENDGKDINEIDIGVG